MASLARASVATAEPWCWRRPTQGGGERRGAASGSPDAAILKRPALAVLFRLRFLGGLVLRRFGEMQLAHLPGSGDFVHRRHFDHGRHCPRGPFQVISLARFDVEVNPLVLLLSGIVQGRTN